jgi:hypothetical protein
VIFCYRIDYNTIYSVYISDEKKWKIAEKEQNADAAMLKQVLKC